MMSGLVAPVGTTYPSGCGRWGIAPYRGCGNAGVVGRISPLAVHRAAGAGPTIIEGGTGGSEPVPVTTLVAFRVSASGGDFECSALAPPRPTCPGSGAFTSNVMYVTGTVTSLSVSGRSAAFRGRATALLTVSGLTFHEILTDGRFDIS